MLLRSSISKSLFGKVFLWHIVMCLLYGHSVMVPFSSSKFLNWRNPNMAEQTDRQKKCVREFLKKII